MQVHQYCCFKILLISFANVDNILRKTIKSVIQIGHQIEQGLILQI